MKFANKVTVITGAGRGIGRRMPWTSRERERVWLRQLGPRIRSNP